MKCEKPWEMGASTLFQFMTIRQVNVLLFVCYIKRINKNRHFRDDNKNIYFRVLVVTVRDLPLSLSLSLDVIISYRLSAVIPTFSAPWLGIRFIFISHSKWVNDGISEFYCIIHRTMCRSLQELCYLPSYHHCESRHIHVCVFTIHTYWKVVWLPACRPEWKEAQSTVNFSYLPLGEMIDRMTAIAWNWSK